MSINSNTSTNWSTEIEQLLNEIRLNSICLEDFHKKRYFGVKNTLVWFRLPIIILSSINALVAVSLTDYVPQNIISASNATISFVIGTLSSIALYLKIEDQLESENDACREFHKLSIDIFKILSLKEDQRGIDGDLFLNQVYNDYVKLFERSNLLDEQFTDKLKLELKFDIK